MEMESEKVALMMEEFLEEAKHKTYFGIFKYEKDVMDSKFKLIADSFTGDCKATFRNYTVVYNSNTRIVNEIVTSPILELSGTGSTTYNMQNETEKLINGLLYATLIGISCDLRSKSTDEIWKTLLKKVVRKFIGIFVDETSRGLIIVILGILIFWMGTLSSRWLSVDHRIQEIKYIPIENLCINDVNCSREIMPGSDYNGRHFLFSSD